MALPPRSLVMNKHTPHTAPQRTVTPTPPTVKRPPASDEAPPPSREDEGFEKARPKDTGRGGA